MNTLFKRSALIGTLFFVALFSQAAMAQTLLDMTLTVDNEYTVFLSDAVDNPTGTDGSVVGSDNNWPDAESYQIELIPGVTNYIHVVGVNTGGPAAFLGEFSLSNTGFEFANGTQTLLTSALPADGWKAGLLPPPALLDPEKVGDHGDAPWGVIAGITPDADWIWLDPLGDNPDEVLFTAVIVPVEVSLEITVTGNGPVVAGSPIDTSGPRDVGPAQFEVEVCNTGVEDATGVTVTADEGTLPAGVTILSYLNGTYADLIALYSPPLVTYGIAALPAGECDVSTYTYTVASSTANGSQIDSDVEITAVDQLPVGSTLTDNDSILIATVADLSIVKSATPEPVGLGAQLTYEFEVDNFGPSDAQNVVTTDDLPPAFEGQVDESTLPGACSIVLGDVVCNWGTLAAGFNTTYSFVVDVPSDELVLGFHENAVAITSDTTDPDPLNSVSDVITQVVAAVPAEGTATLTVQKFFSDYNNETPITLNLQCTNGQPNQSSVTVLPTDPFQPGGPLGMYEVTFVIDNIAIVDDEGASCTVIEEPIAGYETQYRCRQLWSMSTVGDACYPQAAVLPVNQTTACEWSDIQADDSNFCFILNNVLPVDVSVTKVWDITNMGGDFFDRGVNITIYCSSTIVDGGYGYGGYYKTFPLSDSDFSDGEETVTAKVIPNFERTDPTIPATVCWATEDISDSAVETENECGTSQQSAEMEVAAGQGDSCTITNTLFFEGIPTLSQWGMAIMALLMLGVGLVSFRRFA